MLSKHSNHILLLVFLAVVFIAATFGSGAKKIHLPEMAKPQAAVETPAQTEKTQKFIVTEKRRQHILHGDETGGGHIYGAGKPNKSEFPQSWDAEKIIRITSEIANDETLPMRESGRYWLKMKEVDGINVRVVLDKEKGEVVTSYPYVPRKKRR